MFTKKRIRSKGGTKNKRFKSKGGTKKKLKSNKKKPEKIPEEYYSYKKGEKDYGLYIGKTLVIKKLWDDDIGRWDQYVLKKEGKFSAHGNSPDLDIVLNKLRHEGHKGKLTAKLLD